MSSLQALFKNDLMPIKKKVLFRIGLFLLVTSPFTALYDQIYLIFHLPAGLFIFWISINEDVRRKLTQIDEKFGDKVAYKVIRWALFMSISVIKLVAVFFLGLLIDTGEEDGSRDGFFIAGEDLTRDDWNRDAIYIHHRPDGSEY